MSLSAKEDFERVLDILEFKILSGLLNPRERLIERELVDEYKVTTGTVRKILKDLSVKKLVKHLPNRGAVVSEPTLKEVEEIYQTRVLLEGYALDFAVANVTESQLAEIENNEAIFEQKIKEEDVRGILNYNRLFHQSIFENCENEIVAEMIGQLRNRSRIWYHFIRGNSTFREKSIIDHRGMIDHLRSKDIVTLKELNKKHLTAGYLNYKKGLVRL
jgi:DNA-binding GntR family transcriptional regulator